MRYVSQQRPGQKKFSYDFAELESFLDSLADIAAMVHEPQAGNMCKYCVSFLYSAPSFEFWPSRKGVLPRGHLPALGLSDAPYGRAWIKDQVHRHLTKQLQQGGSGKQRR